MALTDDLDRIGDAAQARAAPGERVTAVIAAEPLGRPRIYLCGYAAENGATAWLALDDAANPVADLRVVKEAAKLAALCEVAADTAGGEELDELRVRLRELREREAPVGIEDAEAAAADIAAALAEEPRVATTEFLDRIGALARRLEQTLGTDTVSPFATAMQQALAAVDELADEVERTYKGGI